MVKVLTEDLISKLALQVESFQDGFKILSKSTDVKELGVNFSHILRGSLLITDINLFYKESKSQPWENIFSRNDRYLYFVDDLKTLDTYSISFPENKTYKVICTIPLVDDSCFGIICGDKLDKSEYSEIEKILLQIYLQLLDNAYQAYLNFKNEKKLLFQLRHRVVQLNHLIGTGIDIANLDKLGMQLEIALERAVSLTNAQKGLVRTLNNGEAVSTVILPTVSSSEEILNAKFKIETEVEFNNRKYLFCLANKESRNGIENFDETDNILLSAIAMQVVGALENEH